MIEPGKPLARVTKLSQDAFVTGYLEKNQPVVVADAMTDWQALQRWTPEHLAARFGHEQVQVYGDLFRLVAITPLSDYLTKYFGRSGTAAEGSAPRVVPYVRWYTHLIGDDRVPWADEAFRQFADDWTRPSFFPSDLFALPHCSPPDTIDPSRDWFPARGLFISAKGARTRLHADPWCSDALLCQIYGRKDFVMYDPTQSAYLTAGGRVVDVDAPDLRVFPDFSKAREAVRDTLEPGEIVLVPAGWYHHFTSACDSISLTWNFVHQCRLRDFLSHLATAPPETELKQLAYGYFEAPGRRPLEAGEVHAALTAALARRGPDEGASKATGL